MRSEERSGVTGCKPGIPATPVHPGFKKNPGSLRENRGFILFPRNYRYYIPISSRPTLVPYRYEQPHALSVRDK
jgi:hypothetical protein